MSDRLAGKAVLVTGGSSGIGRAAAGRLAAEGASVVIGARRADLGEQAAGAIRDAGGTARFVHADVTVEDEVAALVRITVDEFGRLDGAFNNAGGVVAAGKLPDISATDWRAELDLNLSSVFYGLKYELPAIAESGGGAILNNASLGGVGGIAGLGAYVAAKHGVVGLTRSAALEWAAGGVRVNAIVTGNVDTPLYRGLLGAGPDDEVQGFNPMGRVATPEEVAAFVAFLLSDESRFVTGAALALDGGSTAG
jgi:NAD(P)-dependent dehydrogenase (short-subunit alcohol dehydrogenase family)